MAAQEIDSYCEVLNSAMYDFCRIKGIYLTRLDLEKLRADKSEERRRLTSQDEGYVEGSVDSDDSSGEDRNSVVVSPLEDDAVSLESKEKQNINRDTIEDEKQHPSRKDSNEALSLFAEDDEEDNMLTSVDEDHFLTEDFESNQAQCLLFSRKRSCPDGDFTEPQRSGPRAKIRRSGEGIEAEAVGDSGVEGNQTSLRLSDMLARRIPSIPFSVESLRRVVAFLLDPQTTFPIKKVDVPLKESEERENIILFLCYSDLIKITPCEEINSISHNLRKYAEFQKLVPCRIEPPDLSSVVDPNDLANYPTVKEIEGKIQSAEVQELLNAPTTMERKTLEKFRTEGGSKVRNFCINGTKEECRKARDSNKACTNLHFRRIIQRHTDESLGDCSFLNACFNRAACKYVHYEVDESLDEPGEQKALLSKTGPRFKFKLFPAQWINCDMRYFDMTCLGKFAVIMADPPWDIHMELPYGTMSDDEMRSLNIPGLQDEGLIFLWVTGRAMELGRECLTLWGYERNDEILWVKTNQLQRLIRTGRTGHWLNHSKEHCLVGIKGKPELNQGVDCDVIVAEVRATSRKPDEIYGIVERLTPGTRKIELFGRQHNAQPNWVTLGNQLNGNRILDPLMRESFFAKYPTGNAMQIAPSLPNAPFTN